MPRSRSGVAQACACVCGPCVSGSRVWVCGARHVLDQIAPTGCLCHEWNIAAGLVLGLVQRRLGSLVSFSVSIASGSHGTSLSLSLIPFVLSSLTGLARVSAQGGIWCGGQIRCRANCVSRRCVCIRALVLARCSDAMLKGARQHAGRAWARARAHGSARR